MDLKSAGDLPIDRVSRRLPTGAKDVNPAWQQGEVYVAGPRALASEGQDSRAETAAPATPPSPPVRPQVQAVPTVLIDVPGNGGTVSSSLLDPGHPLTVASNGTISMLEEAPASKPPPPRIQAPVVPVKARPAGLQGLVTPGTPADAMLPGTHVRKSAAARTLGALRHLENSLLAVAGKDDPAITHETTVDTIGRLEPKMMALSNDELKAKTAEFKARLANGESMDDILPEAFAVVRETARRTLGERPFDVQLLGGIVLAHDQIAEMGTGEGKTLTAVAPTYLRALAGKGAFVITVNDTLAERDAKKMGKVFEALGMTCGIVRQNMSVEDKRKGYNCDVTYMTNQALGFDYLYDNTARDKSEVRQRDFYFGLVDEVDEIFIDQARTPLIIARMLDLAQGDYKKFKEVVDQLVPGEDPGDDKKKAQAAGPEPDYLIDHKKKTVVMTETGLKKVEGLLGYDMYGTYDPDELEKAALRARDEGHGVNVQFQSKEEAQPFIERMAQDGIQVEASRRAQKHDGGVVGVIFPEAPAARRARPDDSAVLLKSGDFSKMRDIYYMDGALKSRALYHNKQQYVVQERPQWVLRRQGECLRLLYEQLPQDQKAAVLQRAQVMARNALAQYQLSGTPPPGVLRAWLSHQKGPVQQLPTRIYGLMVKEAAGQVLVPVWNGLSKEDRLQFEAQARKAVPNDPKGHVELVDEFTGRIMEGRRLSDGLHQAIEAQEGVQIQPETETLASITLPNLFRKFPHLAGMSGTAKTDEEELQKSFGLSVTVIPRNVPSHMVHHADRVYRTKADKYRALIKDVQERHAKGQPVLIGTRSIEVNQDLHKLLEEAGIPHEVLNAESVQDNTEAENAIIARAGKVGAVTIATNMAGRGVDIRGDQYHFPNLARTALDELLTSMQSVRFRNLQTHFDALPHDRQEALRRVADDKVAQMYQERRRQMLGQVLSQAEIQQIATAAGDPAQMGPDAWRAALGKLVDDRLQHLSAEEAGKLDKLVGTPGPEVHRKVLLSTLNEQLGWSPKANFGEADRGVGVTVRRKRDADELYRILNEAGIPVACAEPGVQPQDLPPGTVTIICEGASEHPAELPAGAVPMVRPAAPPYSQPGEAQPGTIINGDDFRTGGLAVLGTERHESRRIDNQLEGRTARQDEDGEVQFYLSAEDDLLKHFSGGGLADQFKRLGMKDDDFLQGSFVDKAIRRAQKSVEAMYFDQRKNTNDYDGALNRQRDSVYDDRRRVLDGQDVTGEVVSWATAQVDDMAAAYDVRHGEISKDDARDFIERVQDELGVESHVPVDTDFEALVASLKAAVEKTTTDRAQALGTGQVGQLFLQALDKGWHEQIDSMANLQQGIWMQGYAQQQPIVVYQKMAHDLYDEMIKGVEEQTVSSVLHGDTSAASSASSDADIVQLVRPTVRPREEKQITTR